jgi:transcriptional regulator with XRE-family HTH domain
MGNDSEVDLFYEQFGLRVRRVRLDRGLNQEALGHRVGLERSSISNIENGRQRVQLHMLAEFAAALGVTPAALLPDSGAAADPLSQVPADARPFVHEVLKSARVRARD